MEDLPGAAWPLTPKLPTALTILVAPRFARLDHRRTTCFFGDPLEFYPAESFQLINVSSSSVVPTAIARLRRPSRLARSASTGPLVTEKGTNRCETFRSGNSYLRCCCFAATLLYKSDQESGVSFSVINE